jgi:hypothetical protein
MDYGKKKGIDKCNYGVSIAAIILSLLRLPTPPPHRRDYSTWFEGRVKEFLKRKSQRALRTQRFQFNISENHRLLDSHNYWN